MQGRILTESGKSIVAEEIALIPDAPVVFESASAPVALKFPLTCFQGGGIVKIPAVVGVLHTGQDGGGCFFGHIGLSQALVGAQGVFLVAESGFQAGCFFGFGNEFVNQFVAFLDGQGRHPLQTILFVYGCQMGLKQIQYSGSFFDQLLFFVLFADEAFGLLITRGCFQKEFVTVKIVAQTHQSLSFVRTVGSALRYGRTITPDGIQSVVFRKIQVAHSVINGIQVVLVVGIAAEPF